MRIIKEGVIPKKSKEVTCRNCMAELEYEPEDTTCDARMEQYVICPCCGKFIYV